MEISFTPNDRGQVGIGTLIVFIAMVLVAAIAAGVLINTAGFLQTQAEDTGTESTEQVANNINVINEVGVVNDTGSGSGEITDVQLGVQPAAGSDDINLEELSLQFVSDSEFSNLVHTKEVSTDEAGESIVGESAVFNTVPTTAEDGSDNVMTDGADRYEIDIPLQSAAPFANASESQDGEDLDDDGFDIGAVEGGEEDIIVIADGDTALSTEDLDDSVEGFEELEDEDIEDDDETTLVLRLDEVDVTQLDTFDERELDLPADGGAEEDVEDVPSVDIALIDPREVNDAGIGNGLGTLDEGEEAEITFTTETGAQTVSILQVPDSLAGQDDEDAVDL